MFRAKPTNPPGRVASSPGAKCAQAPPHAPSPTVQVLPKAAPDSKGGLPLPAHGRPGAGPGQPPAGGPQGQGRNTHEGGNMQHGA